MRLLFGVLSSRNDPSIIEQLCQSLAGHRVLVHHDYSQQPSFELRAENAEVLKGFERTDWGGWGQASAILALLRHARQRDDFDFFQLLSSSCLPVQPVSRFSSFLDDCQPDAAFESMSLDALNPTAVCNFAYRYYPRNRIEKTLMRRLGRRALGKSCVRLGAAGLAIEERNDGQRVEDFAPGRILLWLVERAIRRPEFNGQAIECGSVWFGVSRSLLSRMLEITVNRPDLVDAFRSSQNVDEGLFPTLIGRASPVRTVGLSHFLRWGQRWTGPDELSEGDEAAIGRSGCFFARKFSPDANDPLRARILRRTIAHSC